MHPVVLQPRKGWNGQRGQGAVPRRSPHLRQIDRAHRDFTPQQIEFLSNIVRLYREEAIEDDQGSSELLAESGLSGGYVDVAGLCKAASRAEIEAQGWSLNPGRYVGVAPGEEVSDEDFREQFEALSEQLEALNAQARELEETIAQNVVEILEA